MTKIKLPRAVTEAIEDLRVEGYTDTQIVFEIESGKGNRTLNDYFFDIGTPDELMQALVIGYEVESAPEDAVSEFFDRYQGIDDYDAGVRNGVVTTLGALGIKIEGINAN